MISYRPSTTSPGCSDGSKLNRVPSREQNPPVRPAVPSRPRPTGSPQLPQKRCDSGTDGSLRMEAAGSRRVTAGTATRPAPSRPRAVVRPLVVPAVNGRPPLTDDPPLGPPKPVAPVVPVRTLTAAGPPPAGREPPAVP